MSEAEENARILVKEVRDALARGTKHYSKAGKLLKTDREIIEALIRDGAISFEPAGKTTLPNGIICSPIGGRVVAERSDAQRAVAEIDEFDPDIETFKARP